MADANSRRFSRSQGRVRAGHGEGGLLKTIGRALEAALLTHHLGYPARRDTRSGSSAAAIPATGALRSGSERGFSGSGGSWRSQLPLRSYGREPPAPGSEPGRDNRVSLRAARVRGLSRTRASRTARRSALRLFRRLRQVIVSRCSRMAGCPLDRCIRSCTSTPCS